MSEPIYSYSDQAIISGMEAIQRAHNQIDTALDNLESFANSQLASWDSDARTQYNTYKADWDKHVDNMKSIMVTKAIPSLQAILDNYNLTERFNTNTWQNG